MGANSRWLQEVGDERARLAAEYGRSTEASQRLAAEQDDLLSRIKLLDALLSAYGQAPALPDQAPRPAKTNLAGIGLRDAIRGVLTQSERRLKPAAVVEIMRANGFVDDPGKTDLHVRVSNELWRMAKKKMLSRTSAGYTMKNPSGVSPPEGLFD